MAAPNRKNDQAWVEQRNGLIVRRLIGYDRYSSRAAFTVFQRLYGLLCLQLNFFRPVRKLLSKRRLGSKVLKRYDAPQTPYQGLVAAGAITPAQHLALEAQRQALDPVALVRRHRPDPRHAVEFGPHSPDWCGGGPWVTGF